ncbi:MAG: hypothetical protein M1828_003312 [Chrysothrix sp. TS-e1954]|nr:MAG: hypothetical protein M1828_003312 [Chrysothrix sp. TS-e1954]
MVLPISLAALFASIILLYSSLTHADCPIGCEGLDYIFDAECGVDPHDGSLQEVVVDGLSDYLSPILVAVVTSEVSTTTLSTSISTQHTITFSFPGVNTAISSGSPFFQQFALSYGPYPLDSLTYSPVTSIFYVDETDTATATTSTDTTTTTTQTITTTSIVAQATSTKACTTGTSTFTASTLSRTSMSTITPAPKTIKKTHSILKTVHRSCLPGFSSEHYRQRPRDSLARRQQDINAGSYEPLYCPGSMGSPSSTTYTTSTTTSTTTVTTTDTSTDVDTTTATATRTLLPLTTTVCSDLGITQRVTPTATITSITIAKQKTSTEEFTKTVTVTRYPWHPKPCNPPPRPYYPPPRSDACKHAEPPAKPTSHQYPESSSIGWVTTSSRPDPAAYAPKTTAKKTTSAAGSTTNAYVQTAKSTYKL